MSYDRTASGYLDVVMLCRPTFTSVFSVGSSGGVWKNKKWHTYPVNAWRRLLPLLIVGWTVLVHSMLRREEGS